jgi:hypothetical protein
MRHYTRLLVSSLAALALFAATVNAHAQDTYYPPPSNAPPNGPPPPPGSQAPNGQYVAPLAQQTQQIYVPQSVAMSGPARIKDWDDSQPVPPGYHVSSRPRVGLIVGGAVLFGVMYLLSVLTAAGYSDSNPGQSNGDASLYIPAVGPFMQMANTSSSVGNVFLAIDGLAQCGGLAMFIFGIAAPRSELVRNDLGKIPMIVPVKMGYDGYGAAWVAHF